MGLGGAIGSPSTAYIYDWNMLPIGQALWLKELESYKEFPPMQDPASYNLEQVMQQIKNTQRPVGLTADTRSRRAPHKAPAGPDKTRQAGSHSERSDP